jgi:ABC-2 type transport system ATP-binding protein
MLVQEYLDMVADLRELPTGSARLQALGEAVWSTGIEDQLTRPISALSKGYRQRVCLAQAILHRPKVLILDEPTSGLDPSQVVQVRDLIRRLARDTTVLFSTHILSEVEQVCERAIILLGGKVQLDARLDAIQHSGAARVSVVAGVGGATESTVGDVLKNLPDVRAARGVTSRGGQLGFELDGDDADLLCRAAYRAARDAGWELAELRPVVRDLETVFRDLVAGHAPTLAPEFPRKEALS